MYTKSYLVASFFALASAFPSPVAVKSSSLLATFPNGTSVENLAQRPNGKLLVTLVSPSAQLYELDPHGPSTQSPRHLHTFGSLATSALGIAEIAPADTYAVVTVGVDLKTFTVANASNQAWTVSFRGGKAPSTTDAPVVKLASNVTSAQLLNGLAALPWDRRTVLSSDSFAGDVARIDTATGRSGTVQRDAAYERPPGPNGLGINGLKIRAADRTMFFTASTRGQLGSVALNSNGTKRGAVSLIDLGAPLADDLVLAPPAGGECGDGANNVAGWPGYGYNGAFVAINAGKKIVRVLANGTVFPAFTFDTAMPTALAFDRWNSSTLYVTSADGTVYRLDASRFL